MRLSGLLFQKADTSTYVLCCLEVYVQDKEWGEHFVSL